MTEFVLDNWKLLIGLLASGVTFLAGRHIRQSKGLQEQGTALEIMQNTYAKFASDYEKKYAEMEKQLEALKQFEREGLKERAFLEGQVKSLTTGRESDKKIISELTAKVLRYEERIKHLETK